MYQILEKYPDDHTLEAPPVQLWLIITLEIAVSDDFGSYLLLTYPSYSLSPEQEYFREGYWTPPFVGHLVPPTYSNPETVGAVRDHFDRFEQKLDVMRELDRLAYVIGLSSPQIKKLESFTELKRSPRTPSQVKCYKIVRSYLESIGTLSRRNLADPECRKGYAFLPLQEMERFITKRLSPQHGSVQLNFLSKPLVSNIEVILSSSEQVKARAIKLHAQDFFYEENGLVIMVDLAGYGNTCKYAQENMHTFDKTGDNTARQFRDSVAILFYRFISQMGISQIHMAGDGFICAIPAKAFISDSLHTTLKRFFYLYRELIEQLEAMNAYVVLPEARVGSRVALHYGRYRYGRIAQAISLSADFDGSVIVEVARLESALSSFTKDRVVKERTDDEVVSEKDAEGVATTSQITLHTAICSEHILQMGGEFFYSGQDVKCPRPLSVGVKEYQIEATIFEVVTTQPYCSYLPRATTDKYI